MNTNARNIVAKFTHAMTYPDVVFLFEDMLNDGISSTSDFAEVISRDPGLAATLLRFANSPLYGFPGQVSTIDRAIALVGMQAIGNLSLAVSIKTTFDKVPDKYMSMDDFWRHSLCCALASQHIVDMAVLKMDWFSNTPPVSRSTSAHIGLGKEEFLAMVPQIQAMSHEMRPVFRLAA